jgi:hypothetical protein
MMWTRHYSEQERQSKPQLPDEAEPDKRPKPCEDHSVIERRAAG